MYRMNKHTFNKKWWFRNIRGYNWFSFRYWWFNYILWTLLIVLFIWLIGRYNSSAPQCDRKNEINNLLNTINRELENCCNCIVTPIDSSSSEIDRLRDSLNGKVGELTVTLAWKTEDDLDLMLVEPGGFKIFFSDTISPNNGKLDIDMNRGSTPLTRNPIENIFYSTRPPNGTYKVYLIDYAKNSNKSKISGTLQIKAGSFNQEIPIEISNKGSKIPKQVHSFNYPITE